MNPHRSSELVVKYARVYRNKRGYVILQMWSRYRAYLLELAALYGGHVYHHKTGAIWVVCRRDELEFLMVVCSPLDPDRRLTPLYDATKNPE